ncbi:Cyclin-T2 [Dirofilaria immitis]
MCKRCRNNEEIEVAFQGIQFQIQTTPDEAPWYKQVDPTMSLDKLLKLTEEFSRIYKTHGESLNIKKYAMRSSLREAATPQNPGQPQQQSPQQPSSQQQRQGQNQIAPSIATLPPPPVAPQLNAAVAVKGAEPARRIDLSDYKLRNNAAHQQQQPINSQNSVTQTQRRNFMRPDVLPQIAGKGLDLPLPPIIANEKQLNQSKSEQVTAKPTEATKIVQISKSGTPKPTTSQKPAITNTAKPLHPLRQLAGTSDQERYKKSKPDDYDKDLKYRKTEKTSAEGSHHRKRFHENNMVINQTDNCSIVSATPLTNVSSTPKSGTPKATERQNPTMSVNHIPSGGYSVTSRSRDEATPQSLKRDSNTTSSNNRGRDESTPRQRDDIAPVKRTRQTAPLIALLPTPPSANATPVMSTSSQNSKYSLSTLQTSRSNHIGEGTHRANATTNWSVANDYYMGSSSNNTSRFSQSSGSSNHRHYSSSNTGRTKSREPLLNTPDTGNSYYKRSRPRLSSPTTATTSNAYRQSQRPSSPGNRSGSSYSTLPPPPLPPPNEELEDGEIFNGFCDNLPANGSYFTNYSGICCIIKFHGTCSSWNESLTVFFKY